VIGLIAASLAVGEPRFSMRDMQYEVRTAELPSGLHLVLQQDRSKPLVAIAVVVDVGSASDPVGQEGLAHLVEHLTFRTRADGRRSQTDLLEIAGAGAWNAFTDHDLTTYYAVASSDAVQELTALELSCLLDPLKGIDQSTFETEREVVRNELRERNEQGFVSAVSTQLMASLYPAGHPYARPVIGTEASISKLTLDHARAFVSEHYRPQKMTLVIAGDIDLANADRLLQGSPGLLFENAAPNALQKLPRVASGPGEVPPLPPGPQIVRIKAPVDTPTLSIGWSLPRGFDKSGPLQQAVYRALGGPMVAVFRDEDVTGLQASLQRGKTGSVLVLTFSLAQGKNPDKVFERALDQMFKLWATVHSATLTRRQRAEAMIAVSWLQRGKALSIVQAAAAFESLLERTLAVAEDAHLTGDPLEPVRDIDRAVEVPITEISGFVASWLTRDRARAVFVEPEGSPTMSDATPAVFAAVSSLKLAIPKEIFKKRVSGAGAALKSITLKSGLEVVLARRASGPIVALTLAAKGGESDAEPLGAANMAGFAQIREAWHGIPAGIGVSRSLWSERSTSYLQLRASSGNLEDALGMLRDAVNSLHVDSSADTAFEYSVKDRAQRVFDLPRVKAERDLVASVYSGTSLARSPSPAEYGRISPAQANAWIAQTWTPANSVLTITGDIDLELAEAAARRLLDDWTPSVKGKAGELVLAPRPDASVSVLSTARAGARQTVATLGCAARVTTAEDLVALRVLGEGLSMRLHQTSRVVLGVTYGFSQSVSVKRGIGELRVSGALEDRGLTRILALLRHEAATLGTRPLVADELERARWREGIKSNARLQHSTDLGLALADLRLSRLPAETVESYPNLLLKVTPEDMTRVAGECRKSVVIDLLGEPATIEKAVHSTGS
jgi:zinc protease